MNFFFNSKIKDNQNLKRKFFDDWKSFRINSNIQRYNLKQIQLKINISLVKEYFQAWSIRYKTSKSLNKMTDIAIKHYELIQLSKVISLSIFVNRK